MTVASVMSAVALADPLKFTVQAASPVADMLLDVCNAVAVLALPVNAPVNVVAVTDVNPASVVAVAPSEMLVDRTVIELLVSAPFGILLKFVPVSVGVVVQAGVAPDVAACRTPAALVTKAVVPAAD